MKLDVLSDEELINIIRENVPDFDEEKMVYEVLKKRAEALEIELKQAEKRKDAAEGWLTLFLKGYKYRERTPGRKEYFVPQADLDKHEIQIKELNEARKNYWELNDAHFEALKKSWAAHDDEINKFFEEQGISTKPLFG